MNLVSIRAMFLPAKTDNCMYVLTQEKGTSDMLDVRNVMLGITLSGLSKIYIKCSDMIFEYIIRSYPLYDVSLLRCVECGVNLWTPYLQTVRLLFCFVNCPYPLPQNPVTAITTSVSKHCGSAPQQLRSSKSERDNEKQEVGLTGAAARPQAW